MTVTVRDISLTLTLSRQVFVHGYRRQDGAIPQVILTNKLMVSKDNYTPKFLFAGMNHSPFGEIRHFETEIGDLRESCSSDEKISFGEGGEGMDGTWRCTRDYQ